MAVQGSDNANTGIHVKQNAIVRVNGGDLTDIDGSSGDVSIASPRAGEADLVVPYGTGAGALEEVAGFNGYASRINEGTTTAPVGDASYVTTHSL